MNKSEILRRLDQQINWDEVEQAFIEHWTMCFNLGEVTYFQLADIGSLSHSQEDCFALILIGVARVLSKNIGDCPGDAYEYYKAACKVLEGTPDYKNERGITVRISMLEDN